MADKSKISAFYSHKKVLITGGTGTMGKILIWKLLQSCPNLDFVYVLIRPKRGKPPMTRKKELFNTPIFDDINKNNPKILEKVVFVPGDVGEEGIGLSEKDRGMLINEVDIVFHGAAILKMNANLRTAVNVNTVGTQRLLDLAMRMKKLEAFVHISTAFCCCENPTVEEKIYPSKHNPSDIINLIRWMESDLLEDVTPKLIYPLPNTYIYSKRLAESLLLQYVSKVPIIVARPSIVVPPLKEPIPGWSDTFDGPIGVFVAAGTGLLRVTMMNTTCKADFIPVDTAINSILLLPFFNPKQQLLEEISVYNVSQNAHENLTWQDIGNLFQNSFDKYPFEKFLWYPTDVESATNSMLVYTIKSIFLHYLPAYIIDFVLLLVGRKPFLVRAHDKLRNGEKVLKYFTQQQWVFLHDKLLQLEKLLDDADKRLFTINMNELKDTQSYADIATIACKKFIFKEDVTSFRKARIFAKIMYVIDKITYIVRYYILWKILVSIFNIISNIFQE